MSSRDQALALLRNAETELRKLVGKAATEGDYESVLLLTSLARGAADLASEATDGRGSEIPSPARPGTRANKGPSGQKDGSSRTRAKGRTVTAKRSKRKRRRQREFPKFRRRGDMLVKVGYSKRSGMYTHRAPRPAVSIVSEAMAQAGGNHRLFTTEEILAAAEDSHDPEVLGYQVYMCLAWLRHEGLVQAEGRQGYRIATDSPLTKVVDDRWKILPEE